MKPYVFKIICKDKIFYDEITKKGKYKIHCYCGYIKPEYPKCSDKICPILEAKHIDKPNKCI